MDWFSDWSIDWLVGWLVVRSIGWLIGWLIVNSSNAVFVLQFGNSALEDTSPSGRINFDYRSKQGNNKAEPKCCWKIWRIPASLPAFFYFILLDLTISFFMHDSNISCFLFSFSLPRIFSGSFTSLCQFHLFFSCVCQHASCSARQGKVPELKRGRSHGKSKGANFPYVLSYCAYTMYCVYLLLRHAACHCFDSGAFALYTK